MRMQIKRFLGILLSLALMLGLMPGMSLTAYADPDPDIVSVNPSGSGYITENNGDYTAVPNPGWEFDHWYYNGNEGQAEGESTDNPWHCTLYQLDVLTAYFVGAHTHSFTYSASGDTITATCGNTDGGHTGGLTSTLTIKAPTLTVYGGEGSAEATIEGSIEGVTNPSIVYKKGSETLTSAPTDAGTYTASITLGEATASVEYTIAQASTTITANPTASEINYGQTLTDSTLIGGTASVEGSFAWKDSTVTPQVSDSQTTEYDVVFTPTDGNYSIAECKVKLTVKKVDSAVTKAPGAKTLTYNGQAQELVTAGTAEGGTMQYALGENATTAPTTGYTTSIPTATNAGTYYVWYKACGDANHSDSEPDSVTVTIGETETVATPTFSPEAGTYTGEQSVTISCTTDGAEIYYTTDGSDPSASSTKYSSAIAVGETTTIRAIAVKEGMTDSSVASTTYTISEGPEPSEKTKVEVDDLSDDSISDDLKNSDFNTVSKIEDALETTLSITTEEEKERSKLVDVKLMISTDGGTHYDEATAENFPEDGIDVVLPYPDGTNGDEYSFSVAHMIGTSANGKTAGEIEKPGTTNTSSGISTHFNGLSPVMITWTKNSSPSKDDGKSEEKAHTHHYVWETVEATENSDGELRYKCDICGDIQTRVPITAYYVFNKNTTDKIRKAGQGATVKIETSRFISFHKMVMDALAERPDVTLEISFLDGEYKGDRVIVTIPAGTDALSLLDENGFVGFLYLASKYGYTLDN